MSLSSAKAKLDAQGGDPVTGYISKTDHQESYDELVDDTALTGDTTAEALDVTGALTAGTITSDATVAGTGLAGGLLSSANPVMDSSAAPGTSAVPSRQDHVHPSDTTKVTGPASATDNALVRFDGTGGKTVQNSGITVDDSGNITSDLTVSKATPAFKVSSSSGACNVYFDRPASSNGNIQFRTGTSLRWLWQINSTPESGGNVGSDLTIQRHTDAGAWIDDTLTIKRSTGKVTLGSVGASAGLELGASGPRVMSGTGSPEGVVTAPVGSRWIRTDGATLGDFEYQKRSGTGSTGWVVSDGDTELRDLSAVALSNGWQYYLSEFTLRRTGNLVEVQGYFDKATATADTVCTLPSGFRPKVGIARFIQATSSSDDYCRGYVTSAGDLTVLTSTMTGGIAYVYLTYPTSNAWPSSLPGSAA